MQVVAVVSENFEDIRLLGVAVVDVHFGVVLGTRGSDGEVLIAFFMQQSQNNVQSQLVLPDHY